MGYRIEKKRMDEILQMLSEEYHIYGPCMDVRKKMVRFGKITSVEQIIKDRQSDFSPKEIYYPISQVMFYFQEENVEESMLEDDRKILIFARACDINAIRRSDNLFFKNGGAEDLFYKRLREKVQFVLMECQESFENCFCVSVGSNVADEYSIAMRFDRDDVLVKVCDQAFAGYFEKEEEEDFEVQFIQENKKKLQLPRVSRDNLKAVSELPFWEKFDKQCIGCGGCNTVCGTCTCFDTVDVIYEEGSNNGERKRNWSGCMLKEFTRMAGGGLSRATQGANMRFKVLHKFYDYKYRFGKEHMCVGCGRCDLRCPEEISFFQTVCELHDEIEKMETSSSKTECGNVETRMEMTWDTPCDIEIHNIMKPTPHKILKIVQETQAEFTFRVDFCCPSKDGQYCMLSIPKVGEAPISISGKGENWAEFTIRKVGRLTDGVFHLHEDDTIYLRGPFGRSWPVEEFEGPDKTLLIISGGTGLAPVRTMINYFYEHPEKIKSLYLISGFKDVSGALFHEERAKWSQAEHFNTIYTLDDSIAPGFETGMVTAHIDKVPFESFGDNYHVAIVGPPLMMHYSALGCINKGVPEEKIWVSYERKMQCAVGKCGHCKVNETYVCLEGPVFHYPKAKDLFD